MGWTYTKKPSALTPAQFIKDKCWGEQSDKLIQTATVGQVVYFAFKTKLDADSSLRKTYEVPADGTIIAALIYMIDTKTGPDGFNFGWKDMDETCGPYDAGKCPASILDLLTPLKAGVDSYAAKWRERQVAYKQPALI